MVAVFCEKNIIEHFILGVFNVSAFVKVKGKDVTTFSAIGAGERWGGVC